MSNRLIDLQHITKIFDGEKILDDLNLYIRKNEFLTLLGPSGCGKTTTLRIIGGFLFPDEGNVIFDGKDITQLAPNKRQLNTVFQKYALFPNMNVAENIAFGLKIKKKSKAYIDDKIKYALKLVNLDGYEKRKIDALSGGQQPANRHRPRHRQRTEGASSRRTARRAGSQDASGHAVRTDPSEK